MTTKLYVTNVVNFKYNKIIPTMLTIKRFNNQINTATSVLK